MIFDNSEQEARNEEHATNPREGDYWHEMFCGVCIVLKRKKRKVVICREKVDVDKDHWTWNLDKTETMTIEEFKKWLSYGEGTPGYWAWIARKPHTKVVDYWKQEIKKHGNSRKKKSTEGTCSTQEGKHQQAS